MKHFIILAAIVLSSCSGSSATPPSPAEDQIYFYFENEIGYIQQVIGNDEEYFRFVVIDGGDATFYIDPVAGDALTRFVVGEAEIPYPHQQKGYTNPSIR